MSYAVNDVERWEPARELPPGWGIIGTHAGRWPNLDLVYEPGPHHRVRVWLNPATPPVAGWLRTILTALATAPVVIEAHVWADKP